MIITIKIPRIEIESPEAMGVMKVKYDFWTQRLVRAC
jgi:hypothetical protein